MSYQGDFALDGKVDFLFNTNTAAGAPVTLAGTPSLRVYKLGDDTEVATGVTLTVDYDSITGQHRCEVVLTDAFYTPGAEYSIKINAGTVDSVSQVGVKIGSFSINRDVGLGILGQVHNGVAPSSTAFQTDTAAIAGLADDALNSRTVVFLRGTNKGVQVRVADFVTSNDVITVGPGLVAAPANDDWFLLTARQPA